MKAIVSPYHMQMIHRLRTSFEYEILLYEYTSSLLEKIGAIENFRNEIMREMDEWYIELLELSLTFSLPLVDISLDSRFKTMRRDMYQEFESAIAKVQFEMSQAIHVVSARRIRLLTFDSSKEKQEE